MGRCPACGYTTHPRQQSNESKMIFRSLPQYLKKPLQDVYLYHKGKIPTDTLNKEWHKLVYAIDGANYDVVRSSIHKYTESQYHLEGKGLLYLKAMINTSSATFKQKQNAEKHKFGSNPPEIQIEKGDKNGSV